MIKYPDLQSVSEYDVVSSLLPHYQADLYESVISQMGSFRRILVAFGANLPNDVASQRLMPTDTVSIAMSEMVNLGFQLISRSRLYVSPCFPAGAGPDYVNAAASYFSDARFAPTDILAQLHSIEARHGRVREHRWAGRTLDIDLLAVDDLVLPDAATQAKWRDLPLDGQMKIAPDQLILPHPRMQDRAFVLIPLAEVAPDWRHPTLGMNVVELSAALAPEDRAALSPFSGLPSAD